MPSSSYVQYPLIPKYLQPYLFQGPSAAFPQFGAAQQQLPQIAQLPGLTPELQVPGVTPDQQALIQQMIGAGGASPDLQAAAQQLQQLTAGPIGSSPATEQAMAAWQQNVAPTIEQFAALQGNASGGQALEALQQGQTGALVPLLQQEISNRQQAASQYGQLAQQQISGLAAALEASGIPREVALEQAQAAYEQQQGQLGLETQLQTMPLQLLGQLIGQQGKQSQTLHALDWIGAIGQGISPSGLLSSLSPFGGGGGGGGGQGGGFIF